VLKLEDSVGKGGKNRIDDVRLVQQLVNRFRPSQLSLLKVDGLAGVLTTAAIEQFQKDSLNMAAPDGLVSPLGPTFNALTGNQPAVERVAWGAKVSGAFKVKVLSIARALLINPDFLMSAMAFETGETFSPSVKNAAGSGAVGLIQFMPSTAKSLGTTTDALSQLTAEAQLDFVQKYFQPKQGRLLSIEDTYMAILYPAAIGQPPDHPLFSKGTTVYSQNAGLDQNKDGTITVQEAAAAVRRKFEQRREARVPGIVK
jgi:Transglycosylase SLT domain.